MSAISCSPHAGARDPDPCSQPGENSATEPYSIPMTSYMPDALHFLASLRSGSWSTQDSNQKDSPKDQESADQQLEQEQTDHSSKNYGPLGEQPRPSVPLLSSWLCLPDLGDVTEDVLPSCYCETSAVTQTILFPCHPSVVPCRGAIPCTPPSMAATTPIFSALAEADSEFSFPDVPPASTSTATTRHDNRINFDEAFSQGRLLPFMVDYCVAGADVNHEESDSIGWNGHLPLDPMPHLDAPPPTNRFLNRRRRHKPTVKLDIPLPPDLLLNEEAAAPPPPPAAAADKSGSRGGIRRPPAAVASMSIPANQVPGKGKGKPSKERAGEVEKVQVQQPGADRAALKELPALRDAPPAKREELFIMKLKLCSVIFSFDDPTSDKRGKDMKRQTLLELVDYVNTPAGQKIFTESVMGDLMAMVSANVCRALPPATDDFDPEEDEPVLEPAWPHLQVAYEFFLRFVVSSEVNAKAAKKYVDQKFCLQLVELFDSEDPRERDYLKTILHRIYGKFMSHRSFIRRAISNVFYRFVYETERHNGIGELLEILGSIINGFAIPLKKEHLQFLVRALIPLHKPKCVALYHQQLSYCIIQYVEKDADTATPILNGFFKCWPWSCSGKQVMFLNELEEILELLGADQLAQVSTMLFTNLARCLDSDHFQVVERALFLWNNEHLVNSGCLSRLNAQAVLPIIYGPLYKNSSGHWNATVEGLAQNVLKMYMEYDLVLYDKCTAAYFREEEEAKRKLEAITDRWNAIERIAVNNRPAITVN